MIHVLNGDSTLSVFKNTELYHPQKTFTFREILSEGPVSFALNSQSRANFLSQLTGKPADYKTLVEQEIAGLLEAAENEDVTLWFEHDLICQINLVYLLTRLKEVAKQNVYLICIDRHPSVERFRGLGQLEAAQLQKLETRAMLLNDHEFDAALDVWSKYSNADQLPVNDLVNNDFGQLIFLRNALVAHVERFPSTQNGLNRIEQQMVSYINTGIKEKHKLVKLMMGADLTYGLTAEIVERTFERISILLSFNNERMFTLNKEGQQVFAEKQDFLSMYHVVLPVAGSDTAAYRFNRVSRRLEKQ